MAAFLGEYEVSMDAKGRFLVPAGFRKQLPEGGDKSFIISRGLDNIVHLYTLPEWEAYMAKLSKLNELNPKVTHILRVLRGGAVPVEMDSAGRLLIPKPLQEYGKLSKDLVFTAQGNKMEIWDRDTYYQYISLQSANLSDLAADVFGNSYLDPFQ
ncbi:MAG: division/cell wall cluster transcriptional repressor MraZ [Edaphocola sp.]